MSARKVSSQSFCARQLKILADETRLAVLELLWSGPKHVGEMNACWDWSRVYYPII